MLNPGTSLFVNSGDHDQLASMKPADHDYTVFMLLVMYANNWNSANWRDTIRKECSANKWAVVYKYIFNMERVKSVYEHRNYLLGALVVSRLELYFTNTRAVVYKEMFNMERLKCSRTPTLLIEGTGGFISVSSLSELYIKLRTPLLVSTYCGRC